MNEKDVWELGRKPQLGSSPSRVKCRDYDEKATAKIRREYDVFKLPAVRGIYTPSPLPALILISPTLLIAQLPW